MKERPHRLDTEKYRGERTAAFTACLADHSRGFTSGEVVECLVTYLVQAAENHHCYVPIYCFMPDHLHVMFKGLEADSNLYDAMVAFKHRSGLWMARRKVSFRWQKDFYDHVIRRTDDWRAQATYIAMNPVRAGLVVSPLDYPFTGSIGTEVSEVIYRWSE